MVDLPPGLQILGPTVGGLVVAALVLWRRISRERVESSKDALQAKESTSQTDWLRRLEQRFEQERQRAEDAEARERLKHAELQDAVGRLREAEIALQLARARVRRMEAKCNRLIAMVVQEQPEAREWLLTEPAPLDEPPKR